MTVADTSYETVAGPDLAEEHRLGRLAGIAAMLSVACWVGALAFANSGLPSSQLINRQGTTASSLSKVTQLTSFHAAFGDQRLAMILRCVGLLLSAVMALYVYWLVRARNPQASRRLLLGTAAAGVALICFSTIFGFTALAHLANVFAHGPRTSARASKIMNGSTALDIAAIFDLVSRLVFAAWIAIASLAMLRVKLLDTFLAYWGFGACACLAVLSIGDAMFIGWLGSLGCLALGFWPGGRPEAWTAGIVADA